MGGQAWKLRNFQGLENNSRYVSDEGEDEAPPIWFCAQDFVIRDTGATFPSTLTYRRAPNDVSSTPSYFPNTDLLV